MVSSEAWTRGFDTPSSEIKLVSHRSSHSGYTSPSPSSSLTSLEFTTAQLQSDPMAASISRLKQPNWAW